mmetsp:Transcript_50346/g.150460  ORF Transcript_50346/g.150460 Transcript_50346/m.150460 type:complete len:402 (+) Transcript_50346:840-2045(+)
MARLREEVVGEPFMVVIVDGCCNQARHPLQLPIAPAAALCTHCRSGSRQQAAVVEQGVHHVEHRGSVRSVMVGHGLPIIIAPLDLSEEAGHLLRAQTQVLDQAKPREEVDGQGAQRPVLRCLRQGEGVEAPAAEGLFEQGFHGIVLGRFQKQVRWHLKRRRLLGHLATVALQSSWRFAFVWQTAWWAGWGTVAVYFSNSLQLLRQIPRLLETAARLRQLVGQAPGEAGGPAHERRSGLHGPVARHSAGCLGGKDLQEMQVLRCEAQRGVVLCCGRLAGGLVDDLRNAQRPALLGLQRHADHVASLETGVEINCAVKTAVVVGILDHQRLPGPCDVARDSQRHGDSQLPASRVHRREELLARGIIQEDGGNLGTQDGLRLVHDLAQHILRAQVSIHEQGALH